MLSTDVKHYIDQSVLCWLATASKNGTPNVSPKEMFIAEDDHHLLIANIASPQSVINIKDNPIVCVSFVDVFVQKGYKLKGFAKNINKDDAEYTERVTPLKRLAGESFPIHSVIAIEITEIEAIVAPRYRLYPDTTEEMQIQSAMHTYRVRALSDISGK